MASKYKGHKLTEETKRKISLALKGKVISAESRKKQSEARIKGIKDGTIIIWNKGKKGLQKGKSGDTNPNWQWGRYEDKNGYIWVRIANHPGVNKMNQIAEHRLVMSEHLGRQLESYESVHHKNGIKSDNRIENLQVVVGRVHTGEVKCPYCLEVFRIR